MVQLILFLQIFKKSFYIKKSEVKKKRDKNTLLTLKDNVLILVILAIYVSKFSFWQFIFDLVLTLRAFVASMSYAKILAFGTPNPKI